MVIESRIKVADWLEICLRVKSACLLLSNWFIFIASTEATSIKDVIILGRSSKKMGLVNCYKFL